MFTGKTLMSKICKFIIEPYNNFNKSFYDDFNKSHDELLELNNDLSIHQRNLRYISV